MAANAGDTDLIPGSVRSPGVGNGNLLQYSCLENSMGRGARWATVHGVAESDMTEQQRMHTDGNLVMFQFKAQSWACPVSPSPRTGAGGFLPLLYPPCSVQAQVSESWLLWFVKKTVARKNSSSSAEWCPGVWQWASPPLGPASGAQPTVYMGRMVGVILSQYKYVRWSPAWWVCWELSLGCLW